jgi:NADH-quinone oxidoreductase subunit J
LGFKFQYLLLVFRLTYSKQVFQLDLLLAELRLGALEGLATVAGVQLKNGFLSVAVDGGEVPMQTIGEALLGSEKYQYVLPFEFISVFLLACIIGAIVVARKEKEDK